MYKATVTKSLKDLKQFNYAVIFPLAIFAGISTTLIKDQIGFEAMLYSLLSLVIYMVVFYLVGSLRNKPRSGQLRIEHGKLLLQWDAKRDVSVDLEDISPQYFVKAYRPLGILPKRKYIHLLLDGGPLGPREFFFEHDGEYNASQWEKLGLERIPEGKASRSIA